MLHTRGKMREEEALTGEWFYGEDKLLHQGLLQHPMVLQSSGRTSINPVCSLHYCNPT